MKIIKQGVKNWAQKYTMECTRCSCIAEVTLDELEKEPSYGRAEDQREAILRYIHCPNCQHKVWTSI